MGAIKSGLMFTLVRGPLTRALSPPHYHFSSTISHFGAINSPPRLSEGNVTPHLTAGEHHRWKDLEIWTHRITSGVTSDTAPLFPGMFLLVEMVIWTALCRLYLRVLSERSGLCEVPGCLGLFLPLLYNILD